MYLMATRKKDISYLKRNSLSRFAFFARLMQDDGYFFPFHIDLCDFLQKEIETRRSPRCKVIAPRGSLKSTICTKLFAMWLAIRDPDIRILIVMNTQPNAKMKLQEIRQEFMSNDMIKALFPYVIPNFKQRRWNDLQAELERKKNFPEATFETAGVRSRLTGRHYNAILEDDTVAPEFEDIKRDYIMPAQNDIDRAIGWHRFATPLLVDPQESIRCVVGTRWGFNDMLNWIDENEPSYHTFDRPAVIEGVPIMDKYNPEAIADIKISVGSYMFQMLYMNEPMKPDDMMFREKDWHEYDELPEEGENLITCDPAISKKDDACETAIIRGWHSEHYIFCRDVFHGRITPQETIKRICDMIEDDYDRTRGVAIETVAYQKALALFLRDEMKRRRINKPVYEINSRRSKKERIMSIQPMMENGQIFFKADDKDMTYLKNQVMQYPFGGKLIDCLDCLSMQVDFYRGLKVKDEVTKKRKEGRTIDDLIDDLHKRRRDERGLLETGLRSSRSRRDSESILGPGFGRTLPTGLRNSLTRSIG